MSKEIIILIGVLVIIVFYLLNKVGDGTEEEIVEENEEPEEPEETEETEEEAERKKLKKICKKYLKKDTKLMEERFGGLIKEFDVDGNGLIDIVEGDDFIKLLKLNQEKIVEIDRNYIKQFVQISNYLKTQRTRLQELFEYVVKGVEEGGQLGEVRVYDMIRSGLKGSWAEREDYILSAVMEQSGWSEKKSKSFIEEIGVDLCEIIQPKGWMTQLSEEHEELLRDNAYIFNSLLANSIIMVQSLIKGDMITFYEIYEKLDQLNVFDSKHERDFSGLLGKISTGMDLLNKEVRTMRHEVISGFDGLSDIMEESNTSLQEGLSSVQSTVEAGNIMTSISTYQLYKINQQTKGLNK